MTTLSAIVLVAAGALGGRREAQRRLAEQQRISDAERARRALLEERARIARELHDVVAHHMSVIAIQAEAAPYRVPDPPEELARSFADHPGHRHRGPERAAAGRSACCGPTGPPRTRPRSPPWTGWTSWSPACEAAGLTVTAAVTGTPRPLPPGVELSAYRIVQEALSNAMRHAPGSDVRVELAYRPAGLELRVVNGPARTPPVPGRRGPGTGCWACGSGRRCSAAS